jgi:hypothetical protein
VGGKAQGGPRLGGEIRVVHGVAAGLEPVAEVPHASEKNRDPGLVGPDVGRFLGHLGHPHAVPRGLEPVEGGAPLVELVTEHEDKMARHGSLGRERSGRSRADSCYRPPPD